MNAPKFGGHPATTKQCEGLCGRRAVSNHERTCGNDECLQKVYGVDAGGVNEDSPSLPGGTP